MEWNSLFLGQGLFQEWMVTNEVGRLFPGWRFSQQYNGRVQPPLVRMVFIGSKRPVGGTVGLAGVKKTKTIFRTGISNLDLILDQTYPSLDPLDTPSK